MRISIQFGFVFRLFLCLLFLAASLPGRLNAEGLKAGGIAVKFGSKRCGENGIYSTKKVVWVVVVGSSGNLRCVISITDRLLRASSFQEGYVCVNAFEAKKAEIVSESDPRALRERKYTEMLQLAHRAAAQRKLPVNVVYITTNQGPPHKQPKCKVMLSS